MNDVVLYYHDPIEVDPATSWTGLCPALREARREDIRTASDESVVQLFSYARPDAVVVAGGVPKVSIEQTQMNPSGHNIPQRFSCMVRAAELGVASILYYPEFARRTFSDPNVRYAQVRVPLAQRRLSRLFNVPSLSVFWPTDPATLLPETSQSAHQELADIVGALLSDDLANVPLMERREVREAFDRMDEVVAKYAGRYRRNPSVRRMLPDGIVLPDVARAIVDPPSVARLTSTRELLDGFANSQDGDTIASPIHSRDLTLVLNATTNSKGVDSEHPWPGYLTLLDILYLRLGLTPSERTCNLAYRLPVPIDSFVNRLNRDNPPTATYIVDCFADMILLDGGLVVGRPVRGDTDAVPILTS